MRTKLQRQHGSPARRPRRACWYPVLLALLALVVTGCRRDMMDQMRHEPLEASAFFADGRASRPVPAGTVARGQLNLDTHRYEGRVQGELAESFPFVVDEKLLNRGRQRFDIFCTPCHDRVGSGNGMIVQRGFRRPPSLHDQRLRDAAPGYFFDVITRGFGAMPDYAAQVPADDRWAIVAYIRALQLSQHADVAALPPDDRKRVEESTP